MTAQLQLFVIHGEVSVTDVHQVLSAHCTDSVCCRALHWVTIQMLCVSFDEEIPEVSENVVKAITGQSVSLSYLSLSYGEKFVSYLLILIGQPVSYKLTLE